MPYLAGPVFADASKWAVWHVRKNDAQTLPATMALKHDRAIVEEQEWGRLIWHASCALGNSATMTGGRCEIGPGCANPRHLHRMHDD